MRKTKRNYNSNPDPYEEALKLEALDPYEAQIKSNYPIKQNKKFVE